MAMITLYWMMQMLYYLQSTGVLVNTRVFLALIGFGDVCKMVSWRRMSTDSGYRKKPYTVVADGEDGSISVNEWFIEVKTVKVSHRIVTEIFHEGS